MTKTCFIISSIGKEGSPTRQRSDEVYELIFEPILKELGYKVTRADKIGSPGLISRAIVNEIINSDLAIADVSDENPNVFYELAIRNAVKKPVIVIKGLDQTMPFDIYDKRAIPLDMTRPRVWEKAKEVLKIQVIESEKGKDLASQSILSDFIFELKPSKEPRTDYEDLAATIKDMQQEIWKLRSDTPISTARLLREKVDELTTRTRADHIINIMEGAGSSQHSPSFTPQSLVIKRDDVVLWLNGSSTSHTITSGHPSDNETGTLFDTGGLIKPGTSFSYAFRKKGAINYFCIVHPWEVGKIIVE